MGRIGIPELILILAVFLLFFGAKRLPEIGASIGKAIREFKRGMNQSDDDTPKSNDKPTT